jgi:hypothetical protein
VGGDGDGAVVVVEVHLLGAHVLGAHRDGDVGCTGRPRERFPGNREVEAALA